MGLRILYGVQGTGSGHISRSREIIRNLKADGHQVFTIVSGREPAQLWDMDAFEPYTVLRGLTFTTRRGRVRHLETARRLRLREFHRDVRDFDARGIDLVVTDFEPISAGIARRHGLPSIGVGHQYAFRYRIPIGGFDPIADWILRCFAPTGHCVGLHWHHFGQPILPPVVPSHLRIDREPAAHKVLVYLPFEEIEVIRRLLAPFDSWSFFVYRGLPTPADEGHLHLRPYSRKGFVRDLAECSGVITNAGFQLASEALQLGKKLLVKPLLNQMEQQSNARALEILGLGTPVTHLDTRAVEGFLAQPPGPTVRYPDVARLIADWIDAGDWADTTALSRAAWERTRFESAPWIPAPARSVGPGRPREIAVFS